jgi:RHS repeat-associated protein
MTTTNLSDRPTQRIPTEVADRIFGEILAAMGGYALLQQALGITPSFLCRVTDALGQTQKTTYDAEGNVRSTSDGLGNTTNYDFDALNRQVKVTDAKGGITSTNYDVVGNLAKITDSVGNSTTYSYDAVNRLLSDTNQLGFSRSYAYDNVGNRVEMIDRNGRKTAYGYDSLNRNTSESWIGVGGVTVRVIGHSYDAVGNVLTATDPDTNYIYSYDALNRLFTLDNTGTGGIPAVVLTYSYDAVGNVVLVGDRINGTNAGQTNYVYDQINRATTITQSGTGVQSKRVDMTYNKINQMTGLSRFSDLNGQNMVAETSYTYDQNQRLIQLAHKKGVNNLASYDYTYDLANKLTKIASSIDGTVDYTYDVTNQLTGADHSSQTDEAYQYDANGNRTNSGYQTGTNNQLLADGQYTYEYDHEGNRIKRTELATGKVTEYVWDYHNRLTGVLFKSVAGVIEKNVEYIYDTNNLRIGKKIDGVVTERFAIDRNQIALVFDGSGAQKSRYLYGTQIDQVLAEESGAQLHWFLTDHQGTVKDVVDNAGIAIDHVTYDSFGRIVGQTSLIELRFAYTGREWDGETGQYYYRARYYDDAVGRFISEDPISFNAGDTNLSRYTKNSPINLVDPSGNVTFAIPGKSGLGDLYTNLFVRFRIYGVYPLPGNLSALPIARALVEGIKRNEPIILVAHSDGNQSVLPALTAFLRTTKFSSKCNISKSTEINLARLDPTFVLKEINLGASRIIDVGSNNPGSFDPRDIASLLNPSIDFRAKKGVSHDGLLKDREILDRLQFQYGFNF